MKIGCRSLIAIFAFLYFAALAILLVGSFGLFGEESDPLSGIFLIPLGLPWNQLIDFFPEVMWPWLGAFAPAVNLFILVILCRYVRRTRR